MVTPLAISGWLSCFLKEYEKEWRTPGAETKAGCGPSGYITPHYYAWKMGRAQALIKFIEEEQK